MSLPTLLMACPWCGGDGHVVALMAGGLLLSVVPEAVIVPGPCRPAGLERQLGLPHITAVPSILAAGRGAAGSVPPA